MNEKEFIKMVASGFMGLYANNIFIISKLHKINEQTGGQPFDLNEALKSNFQQIDNFKEAISQLNKPDIFMPGGG